MRKILLGAATLGALGALTIATPADAAPRKAVGVESEQAMDLSGVHRRRHLRYGSRWAGPRYRYVRPYYVWPAYRYYAGGPYWGYPYRPYYRPWYRPAPFPFWPFF